MNIFDKLYNLIVRIISCLILSKKGRKIFRNNFLIQKSDPKQKKKEETFYEYCQRTYNIGKYSYLEQSSQIWNVKETKIGKYCSIAKNVDIGAFKHPINTLSSHPFVYQKNHMAIDDKIMLEKPLEYLEDVGNKKVTIGNDVWIGAKATILPDITIGDGAVIGSNAVVTKNIPPYAIAVGVPAKVIKYRFDKEIIDKLLELKWWNYPEEFVKTLPFEDINGCIKLLQENINLRGKD